MTSRPTYPTSRRDDQIDTYHGTPVADPYRWLEDPESPDTRTWTEAQNDLTFTYLAGLPARDHFRRRLTELWDYPKPGVPWQSGARFFRFNNTGLQDQDVLFVADSLEGEWRTLLDPNTLSADGTVALRSLAVSRDGNWLAYATSSGGSDWQEWRVRRVESGEDLPEALPHSKFSGATWLPDASGFLYGRYPTPENGEALTAANYGQQLVLHRLGESAAQDTLVYERPDEPEWGFDPQISFDGRFLIVHVWKGTSPKTQVMFRPLDGTQQFTSLVSAFEAAYHFVDSDGSTFYFHTDREAPLGKLVSVDVNAPAPTWRDVIPEGQDKLDGVWSVPGGFLALTLRDASHRLLRYSRDGRLLEEVPLPTLGSVSAINTRPDDHNVFFGFTSFLFPTTSYHLDAGTGEVRPLEQPGVNFDASEYVTEQLFATSPDGTRVPMFVVHRRSLVLNGENPTLLYGYGGFSVSLTPSFALARLPWLERGGVLAVANLRGGGEYGEAWHEAGTVHRKQNVFDDFIACAEHLIEQGYTRPQRLAIQGGSNGGLLVGACMTQRPELFAAALPAVGVLDMLRYHRFTIGWAWVSDYGSSDDSEEFQTLLRYSPLHNLRPGTCYPATLITTGDHDDRVVPAHSFKFAAELQRAQGCDRPVLIRVQTRAGHGQGKPTRLVIEEQADIYAFLTGVLGGE